MSSTPANRHTFDSCNEIVVSEAVKLLHETIWELLFCCCRLFVVDKNMCTYNYLQELSSIVPTMQASTVFPLLQKNSILGYDLESCQNKHRLWEPSTRWVVVYRYKYILTVWIWIFYYVSVVLFELTRKIHTYFTVSGTVTIVVNPQPGIEYLHYLSRQVNQYSLAALPLGSDQPDPGLF